MFGQPTTPFGSPAAAPAASPFGAPAPAAGGFGAAATPAPFGSPAPAPAAGGFGGFGGAAAPAPAGGFGGFGAPAPAPAAGGFGGFGSPAGGAGTSAFGSAAPAATPFGAPAPAPGGFGTTGGFGAAPAPAPGGLFGGGAAGGFGSTAPAGAAGFGSTTPAGGFGSTASTGFGAASTTAPAFGSPAPAPSGGLFGSAPAPTFGSTGAATSAFGAPAPAPGGLFGSAPAPSAGGGLFGGGAAANTGKPGTLAFPYQATSKTDGTGSTMINIQAITAMQQYEAKSLEELRLEDYMAGNKGSMGQPGAAPVQGGFGGFGSPAPAPGGFGSPAPAPGAFGAPAPAPGGLFGSAPAPGAFGAPAPAPGGFGAAAPKPLFGSAPAPAPGSFSFGATTSPAPAPAGGFGGFGAAAPKPAGGGLFGSAPAPAPGGLFGGAPAPAPGGLFGSAPAPAPGGLFGSTPAPAPAPGGLFGSTPAPAPAPGGLFGAPAPAPAAGGLFGAPAPAPAGVGLFGAPAPAPVAGGLFGAQAPAPVGGGLFGAAAPKPATGGLFGSPAPAPTGGGLFGAPAPAPAGGSLFGAPPPAPGGLFGAPAPGPVGGGLYGAPTPAPGGLFGAPVPGMAPGVAPYAVPAGVPPPTPDAVLAQQLAAIDRQKQELEQLETWRGTAPSGSGVIPSSLSEKEASARSAALGYGSGAKSNGGNIAGVSSYAASSAALTVYQPSTTPRSGAKIRPRGFGPAKSTPLVAGAELVGSGGTGSSPLLSPDTYLGSSAKRLIIKQGSLAFKPKMRLQLTNGDSSALQPIENEVSPPESSAPVEESSSVDHGVIHRAALDAAAPTSPAPSQAATPIGVATPPTPAYASPQQAGATAASVASPSPNSATTADADSTPAGTEKNARTPRSSAKKSTPRGVGYDFYQRVVGASEGAEEEALPQMNGGKDAPSVSARLPKLTKAGYITSPSLEALSSMSESNLAAVSGFSVSRAGIGSVAWDGAVDVRDVNLDSAVTIEKKDVAVYDAEEAKGTKPPVGSKLNRPAVITMYDVYPKEGKEGNNEVREKFKRRIEKSTKKMGAELISYDATAGIWKFRVKHFSRYALFDDDTEDEEEAPNMDDQAAVVGATDGVTDMEMEQDFDAGDRGGRSPLHKEDSRMTATKQIGARSRIRAPSNEDDMSEKTDEDSVALTSESEVAGMDSEGQMLQAADAAYAMMFDPSHNETIAAAESDHDELMEHEEDIDAVFRNEGETSSEYVIAEHSPVGEVSFARKSNFTARLAKRCGVQAATSSNTDFGLRMGRSFRVGWRPDGSFLFPSQVRLSSDKGVPCSKVGLVQHRPVFKESVSKSLNETRTKALLETHLEHSVELEDSTDGCPFFALPKSNRLEGGDSLSYKSLCGALDDFAEAAKVDDAEDADPEVENVVSRAFSLLSTLIGQEDVDFDSAEKVNVPFPDCELANERRKEALFLWLRQAVSYDVQKDIQKALEQGDIPAALLAITAGCDAACISNLALEHGYTRLSSLAANCSREGCRTDIRRQIEALHESGATSSIPPNILRVYSLLAGDEGIEENLYKSGGALSTKLDWRRRFALKLWCDQEVDELSSLSRMYESDFVSGVAPPPQPRYMVSSQGHSAENIHCILYSLLNLGNIQPAARRITSIVSPQSHTSSPHDFSSSFHLASALSCCDASTQLTSDEMSRLIDGYIMQLIHAGHWEWAVYVCLCAGNNSKHSRGILRGKAHDIVARRCTKNCVGERTFLQSIGIPSAWFDSALAMRCAYNKDHVGQAKFTLQIAPEIAMGMHEEIMMPDVLFRGRAQQLMQRMEAMKTTDLSSWQFLNEEGILYQFLSICKEVFDLSQLSQAVCIRNTDRMGELVVRLRDLKIRLEGDDICSYDGENISRRMDEMRRISRSVCNAELISCLSLLEMQLHALCQGASIFEEHGALQGRRLKVASRLAFLSCPPEEDPVYCFAADALGASDVLRGDHGHVI